MLGIQPSGQSPAATATAAAAVAEAEVLLEKRKSEPSQVLGEILDGRYLVSELIGEGGMGRVYLAEHIEIGRKVAVKVLHKVYNHMPDLVERFRREARAASKIGHPHIVDITDSGATEDGSTYFVMEYLEGVELAAVIDREGALEVNRALVIATQISRALAAAHAVNIIHRDLKPENVFLTTRHGSSDFVKILDFGIAKSGGAEEARERRLTSPGVAMGTPEYMSPEQAAGRPADERCDIYATGAILYEMLGGVPPYEGENFMEILSKKATAEPTPLAELRPELPGEVIDLVEASMARDPGDRPPSMEALEYELTKLTSGRGAAVARVLGLSADASESVSAVPGSNPAVASGPALRSSYITGEARVIRTGTAEHEALQDTLHVSPPRRRSLASALAWAGGVAFLALSIAALMVVVVSEPGPEAVQTSAGQTAIRAVSGDRAAGSATSPGDRGDEASELEPGSEREPGSADRSPRRATSPRDERGSSSARDISRLLDEARSDVAAQRFDAARDKYHKVIASGRSLASGYLGLANIAFQNRDFAAAARYAERAGDSPEALMMKGNSRFRAGDCPAAVAAYRQVLARDPESKSAKQGIERCTQEQ
jgi:serine/threonine protein kinase